MQLQGAYSSLIASGRVRNKKEFAALLGVNYNCLTQAFNGSPRYLTDSLVGKATSAAAAEIYRPDTVPAQDSLGSRTQDAPRLIPIIPYRLYQERGVNVLDYVMDEHNPVQRTPAVAQFADTTCYYFVNTYAMHPHFHPGDVLALKAVNKEAPIINGEIYAIDSIDLGIVLRFVYDKGDVLELRASSERYESFELPRTQIYNLFRVVGMMRTNF